KEDVSNTLSKTPELERSVRMLTTESKKATDKATRLQARLEKEYVPFIEEFLKREPPGVETAAALESELERKRKQREEKTGSIRVLQSQSKEVKELLASGRCPRCGQRID